MKEKLPLKYECLDNFDRIYNACNQLEIKTLLEDLRNLILYQMNEIHIQRMEIVSYKHKESWKHYDDK